MFQFICPITRLLNMISFDTAGSETSSSSENQVAAPKRFPLDLLPPAGVDYDVSPIVVTICHFLLCYVFSSTTL